MVSTKLSKDEILAEIQRIAAESGGSVPGKTIFQKLTGIKTYHLHQHWSRWSDALVEAGFAPNLFNKAYPKSVLLRHLADLTRELRQFPVKGDLIRAHHNRENFPSENVFYNALGLKAEMCSQIYNWVQENPDYSDILEYLPTQVESSPPKKVQKQESVQANREERFLSDSYIPPVISCLPALARAENAIVSECRGQGVNENTEFEKRVAIAFEMVGFSVERLGQGNGRVADGIAKCTEGHWAVIYDAKVRSGGYRMLTEDRKFKEYIDRHTEELRKQGIHKVYFSVVSGQFSKDDLPKAHEVVRQTLAKACVLVEADAIVKLIAQKIKQPTRFHWPEIERYFCMTGILSEQDIK